MRLLTCTVVLLSCYNVFSDSIVEDAFNNYAIVPIFFPVAPPTLLSVRFGDKVVNLGNIFETYEVPYPPLMTFNASSNHLYTLLVLDFDQPSILVRSASPYLSYLRVNIPGANILAGDYVSPYVPPSPIPGSAYHRFVYLVYKQTDRIDTSSPDLLALPGNFSNFTLSTFTSRYNLSNPIAGNFFLSRMDICNNDPMRRVARCR